MFQSGSGVFRICIIARKNLSVSKMPDGPVFDRSSCFVALTATSARQLDWGLYAEESLWETPHCCIKSQVEVATNSGPPSLENSEGTSNLAK